MKRMRYDPSSIVFGGGEENIFKLREAIEESVLDIRSEQTLQQGLVLIGATAADSKSPKHAYLSLTLVNTNRSSEPRHLCINAD